MRLICNSYMDVMGLPYGRYLDDRWFAIVLLLVGVDFFLEIDRPCTNSTL